MTAIQMATLNTAEHFGVSHAVGQIAPGRWADILLVSDLPAMKIDMVLLSGKVAIENGDWRLEIPPYDFPAEAKGSVHLGRPVAAEDFRVEAQSGATITANVIGVVENQAPTRHLRFELPVRSGLVQCDLARDVCKVALVERHRGTRGVQVGFVHGFGLNVPCAIASTVAHDSHQLLVVGTDEAAMALAANELARIGGGMLVVKDGRVEAVVELPIGGLMSDERAEVVAAKAERVLAAYRACGCHLNNANMQLSLLALVVIPELRISDLGLVDVNRFEFVPVLEP
jgi:adenine deaminase